MQAMQSLTGDENAAFDPGALTNSDRAVVEDCAHAVWNYMRITARDAVVVGRKLKAVKKILGHGRFIAWLRTEGALSADTAERLMKIAERFGDIPQNAEFTLSAFYALITNDTSESARKEAMERAAKGEKITPAVAKAIKASHATAAVPVPPSEESQPIGSKPGSMPSDRDVADAQAAVTGLLKDRDPASSSSVPDEVEATDRPMKPRDETRGGGAPNRPEPGPFSPIRRKSVSPDELVEAIDRLLAVMPADGRLGWEKFAQKVRQLPTERRRMLIGKLTILADKAVDVRRSLSRRAPERVGRESVNARR